MYVRIWPCIILPSHAASISALRQERKFSEWYRLSYMFEVTKIIRKRKILGFASATRL
jgi:hypothetical protein